MTEQVVEVPETPEIGPDYAEQLSAFLAAEHQTADPGPAEEASN